MSSSDILDVLNINEETRAKSKQKRTSDFASSGIPKKKKMSALNRELYNLIGSSAPPIAVEKSMKFKDKLKSSKPTPWSWEPFKNGVRSDGLELHHWVKGPSAALAEQPYQFEKFNKKLEIPELTEQDYISFLRGIHKKEDTVEGATEEDKDASSKDDKKQIDATDDKEKGTSKTKDDKETEAEKEEKSKESESKETEIEKSKEQESVEEWTYEETKYLFDLCNAFDLRWAIIYDRFEFDGPKRTVDDLKEQFYKCSAILLKNNAAKDNKTNTLIQSLEAYDKNKEKERKAYLNRLLHRSPTEIAEEESLVIEARKFELAAKKMLTERAQLLQLLDSPQSSASIQQYLTSQGLTQLYNSLITSDKSKKRKPEIPVAPQLGPNALPHSHHQELQRQRAAAAAAAAAEQNASNSNHGHGHGNNHANSHSHSHSHSQSQSQSNKKADKKQAAAASSAANEKSEAQDLINSRMSQEDQEIYGLRYHEERLVPGVVIRSNKLNSYKPATQTRVTEMLNEMGLSTRPTIPTGKVCLKFDQLLYTLATLIDSKRQTDKLQTEINLIKHQKGLS